jgi:hypothetical protein
MKRFKFPNKSSSLEMPTLVGFEFPTLEDIKNEIKLARNFVGYSKSSRAKYIIEVDEDGKIPTFARILIEKK